MTNLTDMLVIGFVGSALLLGIYCEQYDLAMALGTGLLGYVGATKVPRA